VQKDKKKIIAHIKNRFENTSKVKFTPTDILYDAWENLPYDFSEDEKYMFLEIAEQMIKLGDTRDEAELRN